MFIKGKIVPMPNDTDIKFVSKIEFNPGTPGTRVMLGPWRGVMIHWTGGERGADAVVKTLADNKLSVHFIVEEDGRIVQTADLSSRCSHGGIGNGYYLGIEVVCRGYATKVDLAVAMLTNPDLRRRDFIDWSAKRDTYRDTIAGQSVHMASFNPAQLRSVVWLCETLSAHFKFPRAIPAAACKLTKEQIANLPVRNAQRYIVSHKGINWLPSFDRDVQWRPGNFRGAICHFHIHPTKHDGGTQPLWRLWELGWNPAEALLDVY